MTPNNPFPELYILRHGETVWNAENRMQGGLNSPLTEKGRAQAARQAELLAALDLQGFAAICSPQGRAFETAAIAVARHIPTIRTDDRLREIGVGEWQGKLREGLWVEGPVDDGPDGPIAFYEQAPGGEGFAALEARCRAVLRRPATSADPPRRRSSIRRWPQSGSPIPSPL